MRNQRQEGYQSQSHFFEVAAMIMRRILVDHARARSRLKRGGQRQRVELDENFIVSSNRDADILAMEEALQESGKLDERQAAWGIPLAFAMSIFIGSVFQHWKRRGQAPATVGHYAIKVKIAEGGLGIVYRAEHRLLGKWAAIKLLKPEAVHRQGLVRFEREVRLASRLVHPNA